MSTLESDPGRNADLSSFGPDDDPVELTRDSAVESEMIAAQLRGAGIATVVLGVGTGGWMSAVQFSYGSRIMVRGSDLEAAQTVLADLFDNAEPPAPIDDDALGALAEASTGWSDPETGAVV
jgi:Putative prokaryotic signal transducing protein